MGAAEWFVLLDDSFFVALPALTAELQKLVTASTSFALLASIKHASWQRHPLIFNRRALELFSRRDYRGQQKALVCTRQLPSKEPWSATDCLAERSIFTRPSGKGKYFSSEMVELCYRINYQQCPA